MTIRFRCANPSCRQEQEAAAILAGRLTWCAKCHLTLRIPAGDKHELSTPYAPELDRTSQQTSQEE